MPHREERMNVEQEMCFLRLLPVRAGLCSCMWQSLVPWEVKKNPVGLKEPVKVILLEVLKGISRKISREKCIEMTVKTSSVKRVWFCAYDTWIMT